jgi:hypothetical protein
MSTTALKIAGQVRLRVVVESDIPVFFEQQLEPEALRRARFRARDHSAFTAHWAKIMADPSGPLANRAVSGSSRRKHCQFRR